MPCSKHASLRQWQTATTETCCSHAKALTRRCSSHHVVPCQQRPSLRPLPHLEPVAPPSYFPRAVAENSTRDPKAPLRGAISASPPKNFESIDSARAGKARVTGSMPLGPSSSVARVRGVTMPARKPPSISSTRKSSSSSSLPKGGGGARTSSSATKPFAAQHGAARA